MTQIDYQVSGFSEAVFVVADLVMQRDFYLEVVGWQEIANDNVQANEALAIFWDLPEEVTVKQSLLAAPNSNSGFIRLIQIDGIEQEYIRPNNQIWDSGGIFDVNTRVVNNHQLAKQLHAHYWFGVNDPVPMEFGPYKVIEWLAKGPDAITFACIERIEPPLANNDQTALFSALFNSSLIVNDHQAELAFFQELLGFEIAVSQQACFEKACTNVFGLPHNLVDKTPHKLSMVCSPLHDGGSIELASFPELQGGDVSEKVKPYNIGISTLRFKVNEIDAFILACQRAKLIIVNDLCFELPHYGMCRVVALKSPQGNWFEFYQPISK